MTLFEELEGTANRRLQGARCEVRKEVTYRTGGTKGVEGWRKRVREEGAVGGSVAGSTAGWWPSDRDRFPPRFLLPPSLQTHNCIISTHLASSPSPSPSTSLAYSLSLSSPLTFILLSLFLFPHRLPTLRSPPSRSDPMRAFALAPLVSSRSFDRPAGRSFLSLHRHISRLLSSFARKSCHTRETAHRLLRSSSLLSMTPRAAPPRRCSFLACTILPLALNSVHIPSSLSLFLTSRSRGHAAYSLLHSSSSLSSFSRLLRRRCRFVLFIFFVSRSSFSDRAGNTDGYAIIYPTRRGQSADRKDGIRR